MLHSTPRESQKLYAANVYLLFVSHLWITWTGSTQQSCVHYWFPLNGPLGNFFLQAHHAERQGNLSNSCSNNCHSVTTIIIRQSLSTSPERHVFSGWVTCSLSKPISYKYVNLHHPLFHTLVCQHGLPIYLMLTWITQTPFWPILYIDLDHWYIYHFHNVIYIYAHLDHQGPFIF